MRSEPVKGLLNADALCQRLDDIATYLSGIAAVVEGMNKGAADGLSVAINAVCAVSNDLRAACEEIREEAETRGSIALQSVGRSSAKSAAAE